MALPNPRNPFLGVCTMAGMCRGAVNLRGYLVVTMSIMGDFRSAGWRDSPLARVPGGRNAGAPALRHPAVDGVRSCP